MHRNVGDIVDFPYRDTMRRGTVVSVRDSITCLIEAEDEVDGGLFFEKGDDITYLPESARCSHCGGFAFQCQSDCPAKKRKPRKTNNKQDKDMSKVTLADIIAMEPGGFINDSFDAVWVSEPAVSQKKEVYYKVKLVSPTNSKISIAAKIWGEVDHKALNGKLVEFGGKGLQRSEYKSEKSPKATQQVTINVTAKDGSPNDNFRIIGESAHSDKPLPFQGSQQRADLPERSTGVSGQSTGQTAGGWVDDEISRSTVGERVYDYFRVMGTVINAHKKLKDELGLPEFSPTDLKEITTGICMSYKGRYGVFMAPIFSDASPVSSEPKPASVKVPDETGWDDVEKEIQAGKVKQPAKKIESSWKSFVHPRRNVALGAMKDDELVAIARWAVSVNGMEMTGNVARFHQAAMFMAAERDWVEPEKCLMASFVMHPEYEKGFSDDDVEAVSQKMFKTSINDLADTEGAVIGLLKSKEFDAFIKECIEHKASSEIPY